MNDWAEAPCRRQTSSRSTEKLHINLSMILGAQPVRRGEFQPPHRGEATRFDQRLIAPRIGDVLGIAARQARNRRRTQADDGGLSTTT
jgi:hypothetical protein